MIFSNRTKGGIPKRLGAAVTVAFVSCICLVSTAPARAGGNQITGAPQIPVGQTIQPASGGADFWALQLNAGDAAQIDFGTVVDDVGVCIWDPSITDFTVSRTDCKDYASTQGTTGKEELTFKATTAGAWTVLFINRAECNFFPPVNGCDQPFSYQAIVTVRRFTSVALTGPGRASLRRPAAFVGRVNGASDGTVAVRAQCGARKRGLSARIGADGGFSVAIKMPRRGHCKVWAVYAGDDSHLSSRSFSRKVTVG